MIKRHDDAKRRGKTILQNKEVSFEGVRDTKEIKVNLTPTVARTRRGSENEDAPISPRDLAKNKPTPKIENKPALSSVVTERPIAQEIRSNSTQSKLKRQSRFRQNLNK